jgi:hypothetical protein
MILERHGVPAFTARRPDGSWRTWAYQAGLESGAVDLKRVTVVFTPLARDNRSVRNANSFWPTVEDVVDGLIGARVLSDRSPASLAGIVMRSGEVVGVDGLRVSLLGDGHLPAAS